MVLEVVEDDNRFRIETQEFCTFWLQDTPANRKVSVVYLRNLCDEDGKALFTFPFTSRSVRWKKIGRAVFGDRHERLVTMHPCGQSWVADEFRHEDWFDFIGYQKNRSDVRRRWRVDLLLYRLGRGALGFQI